MKFLIALALLVGPAIANSRRYDGYQVYSVQAKTKSSFEAVTKLYSEQSDVYDFWTEPRSLDHPMDIMVPPAYAKTFTSLLQQHNVDYNIKVDDVQRAIEVSDKDKALPTEPLTIEGRYALNWTAYHTYTRIVLFMNELATRYPDKVSLNIIGKSYENRDIYMVTISNKNTTGVNGTKKAIAVDSGIHAREWIAPAFTTWLISELVERYDDHPQYVDNVVWYILPVLNPDGYEYAFNDDRLWRKNRRPSAGPCVGVDLNRNFGFHWNEGGAAGNACDQTYHGPDPFSEPESQVIRDNLLAVAFNTAAYLTVHSYGQYWLTPWGYTSDLPDDYSDLYDLGVRATDALTAVNGTVYTIGSSTNVLYIASGGSDDWAKGVAGIKYSYTVELRDAGEFGFVLPAEQIIPTSLETWEAVKIVAEEVMRM